ncbi:MAG: OmpA family protein, partial [Gammaproteobacteria bacterium]
ADINAGFDEGFEPPVRAMIAYIGDHRSSSHELGQQIADRDAEIVALQEEVTELQERLGGAASEQQYLQRRLMAQENLRRKVKQIEGTFERQEAEVFRDANEIYIRLVGLSFDSGSADIGADNFLLLTKVEDAIDVFPNSRVIIEGHTDSHGADDSNLALSEQRAASVRKYLLVQRGVSPKQVEAVGYGEMRPVANNETPQGRARNRRIDVRIVPESSKVTDLAAVTFSGAGSDEP